MIRAVIFDVDGTLVDSVDVHAEAWRRAFAHFGHDIAFDDVRAQIGKGGDQLLPVFLDEAERRRVGEKLEAYRAELFKAEYLDRVRGFPAAADLVRAIRDRGVAIALASSAKGDELAAYKRAAGIDGLTDIETSSEDADRSKPHPDILEAALAKLGLPASATVMVGDTPYDAEAATRAGIRTIGVLCGGFAEADLRAAGASPIFRGPHELLAALDTWLGQDGGRPQ